MILKVDPSQTTLELAEAFSIIHKIILIHLRQSGKEKKLKKWVGKARIE